MPDYSSYSAYVTIQSVWESSSTCLRVSSYTFERCFCPSIVIHPCRISNPHHFVVPNFEDSYIQTITAGIPKCSVLRPLLYFIFTSNLPTTPIILLRTFVEEMANIAAMKILKNHQPNYRNISTWMY